MKLAFDLTDEVIVRRFHAYLQQRGSITLTSLCTALGVPKVADHHRRTFHPKIKQHIDALCTASLPNPAHRVESGLSADVVYYRDRPRPSLAATSSEPPVKVFSIAEAMNRKTKELEAELDRILANLADFPYEELTLQGIKRAGKFSDSFFYTHPYRRSKAEAALNAERERRVEAAGDAAIQTERQRQAKTSNVTEDEPAAASDSITSLEVKVAHLEAELATLRQRNPSDLLRQHLATASTELADLTRQLEHLQERHAALSGKCTALETTLAILEETHEPPAT